MDPKTFRAPGSRDGIQSSRRKTKQVFGAFAVASPRVMTDSMCFGMSRPP